MKYMNVNKLIDRLIEGNKRFIRGNLTVTNESVADRRKVSKTQKPFAVIIACSDSRVPPILIFDQKIGDLFVIRVAGNIVDDVSLGSIEFAVKYLDTKLIVVLGHKRCGAVEAAINNTSPSYNLEAIVKEIKPAVERARLDSKDLWESSIMNNVDMVVDKIRKSKPIIKEFIDRGEVKVIGGYYDIDNGKVDFII